LPADPSNSFCNHSCVKWSFMIFPVRKMSLSISVTRMFMMQKSARNNDPKETVCIKDKHYLKVRKMSSSTSLTSTFMMQKSVCNNDQTYGQSRFWSVFHISKLRTSICV